MAGKKVDDGASLKKDSVPRVAFFDVDNTVVRGNTGIIYAMGLFFKGKISVFKTVDLLCAFVRYRLNRFDAFSYFNSAFMFLEGWDVKETEKIFDEYFEKKVRKRVSVRMMDAIRMHKMKGDKIALVTNTQRLIALPLQEMLGADFLAASEFETKDGKFTGRMKTICYGTNKVAMMREIVVEAGVDFSDCFAYSDSYSDLPMLDVVGNPVAVSPDRKLRKHALANNWRIMRN